MDTDHAREIVKRARAIMANEYRYGRKPDFRKTIWQAIGNYAQRNFDERLDMFYAVAKLIRPPKQLSFHFTPPRRTRD